MKNKIRIIQDYLKNQNKDAWVIYDYECTNDALISLIGKRFLTRKIFMVFPAVGKPYIICHTIDIAHLGDDLIKDNFDLISYRKWEDLLLVLKDKLSVYESVVMEMSEDGCLPRASYCDFGTISLIKKYVKHVDSSADLLMTFNAPFNGEALELHKRAMKTVAGIKDEAFAFIEECLRRGDRVNEYTVQKLILDRFEENGLVTDSNPIVAVNGNAGNPHYEPNEKIHDEIKKGDLILIDLWAKYDCPQAVYADITWMAYAGKKPPEKYIEVFDIVKGSIDAGLKFLNENLPIRSVCGYEVDDCVRNYITERGYGDYFIHRTGHSISIDESPHGKGVNIDGYETHDTRHLINNVCFSIEPGIYTDQFGCREEINVYINEKKACVTAPRQDALILLDVE